MGEREKNNCLPDWPTALRGVLGDLGLEPELVAQVVSEGRLQSDAITRLSALSFKGDKTWMKILDEWTEKRMGGCNSLKEIIKARKNGMDELEEVLRSLVGQRDNRELSEPSGRSYGVPWQGRTGQAQHKLVGGRWSDRRVCRGLGRYSSK